MKFYSPYTNLRPSFAEAPCPKEIQDYILDEASGELIPSGTINTYERTQSYYESTRLSTKLARFGLGDSLALGVPRDCNIDIVGVPADLREVLDCRKDIQKQFSAFPAELRQLFNNDYYVFEKSVSEGSADKLINDYIGKLAGLSSSGQSPNNSEPSSGS